MVNGKFGVITDDNGLYYMRARYYNVDIKRFINQDVLTGDITSSPSLNRYSYCEGNPVSLSDPFGLSPFIAILDGIRNLAWVAISFIPVVGDIIDIYQGIQYAKEGNYGAAALCFVGGLPFAGDIFGKTLGGIFKCKKLESGIRYGARMLSNGTLAAVGGFGLGYAIGTLINDHVIQGKPLTLESLGNAGSGVMYAAMLAMSVKSVKYGTSRIANEYKAQSVWCFVEGTLVHTLKGNVEIQDIELGDYVLAYNEETGETGYQRVVRLFRNTTDSLAHVEVGCGIGKETCDVTGAGDDSEEIICTPGHKFYVEGEWIAAEELEAGDVLTLADGTKTTVLSVTVEELETPEIIYNFEVENWHNYYVAENGVLVHNETCETRVVVMLQLLWNAILELLKLMVCVAIGIVEMVQQPL